MARLKAACYCWSLRTGALVIGWLTLLSSTAVVLMATLVLKPIINEPAKYDDEYFGKAFSLFMLLVIYAVMAVTIITVVALLYGAYTERPYFLLPYLVSDGVMLVCIIWAFIEWILREVELVHFVPLIISAVGVAYFLVVVGSYFAELRSERNQADVVYTSARTTDKADANKAEEGLMG